MAASSRSRSPRAPQPLTLVEQYVYTNGACHVFLEAARRVLGGRPTILVSEDEDHKRAHDSPPDEPLELHLFLLASDGRAVDAEGKRSLDALAIAFGVPKPYLDYGLIDNADPHAFGKPSKKMVDKLEQRLRALDWRRGHVPEATDRLSQNKLSYAWAAVHAAQWWEEWERTGALPPPDPPESEHDLANFVEDAHLLDEEELAMEIEDLKEQWAEQLRAPKQPAKKSSSRRKKP